MKLFVLPLPTNAKTLLPFTLIAVVALESEADAFTADDKK